MKPDNPNDRRPHSPLVPQRPLLHSPHVPAREEAARKAAAGIARNQVESIYSGHTSEPTPQTAPVAQEAPQSKQQPLEAANPYQRTHTNVAQVQAEQWKKYHSAWQQYYQKYYERYYVGQVYQARQELEARAREAADNAVPKPATPAPQEDAEALSRSEAMYDLRSKLRGKLHESAKKARRSRHFVPITAALCVMLVFLFLQFNRVIFSNVQAYISPGAIDPANIIVDPTADIPVGPEPKLIIPKINVDVPVDYTAAPDHDSQMKAMENGVAWFGIPGANSKPGQVGNTVLSGHSSNDIIDGGNYKFIFARLDHLQKGDTIYANYESKRYTYTVTKKEVVKPTDVQALIYKTDKPVLTLITCTPLGTSLNRLLVTAEQVSPNPDSAKAAPKQEAGSKAAPMPGNSPTFVERLFGR